MTYIASGDIGLMLCSNLWIICLVYPVRRPNSACESPFAPRMDLSRHSPREYGTVILLSRHQIISQKNEQLFVFCDIILIPLSTENVASRSDEISKRSISSWTSYLHLSAWIFDPFLVLTISSLKLPIKSNDCKNFLHLFLR